MPENLLNLADFALHRSAHLFRCSAIASPQLGFAHELAHAANWDTDPQQFIDDSFTDSASYGDMEEYNAVQKETTIAHDLGEPTRSDHAGIATPVGFFHILNAFPDSALAGLLGTSPTADNMQSAFWEQNPDAFANHISATDWCPGGYSPLMFGHIEL